MMQNTPGCKRTRPRPGSVSVEDRFWTPYIEKIRTVTLPYVLDRFEACGYLNNYALVAGTGEGESKGPHFSDGLLCEAIRGASDLLAAHYDPDLDARLDRMIAVIAAASEKSSDGYLCTPTILRHPDTRWGTNGGDIIVQHDVYDQGALVEAGISHYLATGKTTLLRPAVRAANCICREIGMPPKLNIMSGHSLAEEAFVKLYCLFRDHRELDDLAAELAVDRDEYLRVASFWYDARGYWENRAISPKVAWGRPFNQDHVTFTEQREAVGHAVRATLCYTGAAAVARVCGRDDFRPALDAIWENITMRKIHISGGIGARHDIEGFDVDYNLPNNAYLETCAAVGLAFFAGEMGLLAPRAEYFDIFEQALCNNILASVAEDGLHYFYQNPLQSDGSTRRWEWHTCPCCPPMLLKLYGALGSYIYTVDENDLYINLHIGSCLETEHFAVRQADNRVILDSRGQPMTVHIRIPGYAEHFAITQNGVPVDYTVADGYAVIARTWCGDVLDITYCMPPRRICANPAVEADRGCVAVMHGPWLMCAEGIDNDGEVDLTLAKTPALGLDGDGVTGWRADGKRFRLIPYYRWCNRPDSGPMQVWFRQDEMVDAETLDRAMQGALYANYDLIN